MKIKICCFCCRWDKSLFCKKIVFLCSSYHLIPSKEYWIYHFPPLYFFTHLSLRDQEGVFILPVRYGYSIENGNIDQPESLAHFVLFAMVTGHNLPGPWLVTI